MSDILSTAQSYACLLALVWAVILSVLVFRWLETHHPVAARITAAFVLGCVEGLFSRRRRRKW